MEEATRRFAAHGFDGASLTQIAEAVGVRKASLLYHFSSKEALRQAVLDRVLRRWRKRVPRLLKAATSGQGQFEAVVGELVGFFAADPDRARLLLREALDRPAEMRELVEDHVRPWVGTVCDHIEAGQKAGRVHGELDPEAYVAQLINMVIGSVATFASVGALIDDDDDQRRAQRHLDELQRIARSSLFRSPRPTGDEPERSTTESPSGDEAAASGDGTR